MDLFTLILDYDGGTYIAQIESDTPRNAAIKWALNLEIEKIPGLGHSSKKTIIDEMKDDDKCPVAVEETINTWCSSFTVRGKLGLINIVKTKKQ